MHGCVHLFKRRAKLVADGRSVVANRAVTYIHSVYVQYTVLNILCVSLLFLYFYSHMYMYMYIQSSIQPIIYTT